MSTSFIAILVICCWIRNSCFWSQLVIYSKGKESEKRWVAKNEVRFCPTELYFLSVFEKKQLKCAHTLLLTHPWGYIYQSLHFFRLDSAFLSLIRAPSRISAYLRKRTSGSSRSIRLRCIQINAICDASRLHEQVCLFYIQQKREVFFLAPSVTSYSCSVWGSSLVYKTALDFFAKPHWKRT